MEGRAERDGPHVEHERAHEELINEEVDNRIEADVAAAVEGGAIDERGAEIVEEELEAASDVAVLADLPAFSAAYVEAEMIALRTSHNKILEVLRDAGLIPTA